MQTMGPIPPKLMRREDYPLSNSFINSMKIKFGNIEYRDIERKIVPISPKSLSIIASEVLEESLTSSLLKAQSPLHIKNWRFKFASSELINHEDLISLRHIRKKSMLSLGNQRLIVKFYDDPLPPEKIEIIPPTFCKKIEILNEKKLKTQYNVTYLFIELSIDLGSIAPIELDWDSCSCPWESLWANGHWGRIPVLYFICRICGKFYVCECFRNAIEIFKSQILKNDPHKVQNETKQFLTSYKKIGYRKKICHLCTQTPADFDSVFKMKYHTSFRANYYPYINREVVCNPEYWDSFRNRLSLPELQKKISRVYRKAENRVRKALGTHPIGFGWATEAQIYYMIEDLFPNEPIINQASPSWLEWMRFDIFLPMRKVAVEYQGIQHFKPVPHFGGEEGLAKTKERDKKKLKLATENGIQIIYIYYNEQISRDKIKNLILNASNVSRKED